MMDNERHALDGKVNAGADSPASKGYVVDLKKRWKLDEDNPVPNATGLSNKELGILEMAREDIKECVKIIETAQTLCEIYFNIAVKTINENEVKLLRDKIISLT